MNILAETDNSIYKYIFYSPIASWMNSGKLKRLL